jgi:predicted aspartyl protease
MSINRSSKEVIESFTFRNLSHAVTADALIDTGSDSTVITLDIARQLQLPILNQVSLMLADDTRVIGHLHRCVVAWSMYESQGYFSIQDVVCSPGKSVIIGTDFLKQHELSVDLRNMGLVGYAPENAVPLTGGGYVINPPKGFVLNWNRDRADAAFPGETLRPHPAWRFKLPAITRKQSPSPPNTR